MEAIYLACGAHRPQLKRDPLGVTTTRRVTTPARGSRSLVELLEASEHLYYELWMLNATAYVLAMRVCGEGPLRNALLESFTIHARGLLQFFFPHKPWADDMLAADFVADPASWEQARGAMPATLTDLAARVGKEVAHLTYGRLLVTEDTKPWQFVAVAEEFARIAAIFRSGTPGELLTRRWYESRDA